MPATRSMSAWPSCPGRSSTGAPREQSTMVDSMPTSQAPPSSTSSASPNSAATCAAVVGLTRPKRLALGAASPCTPRAAQAASSACATGCAGQRRPTVGWPPAAASAMPGRRGRISVNGPGQKASISRPAKAGTSAAKRATPAWLATWTISGWSAGRPLAAKMPRTAASLPASAARPYTVSVGNPTSSPAASASAARAMASGEAPSRIKARSEEVNTRGTRTSAKQAARRLAVR